MRFASFLLFFCLVFGVVSTPRAEAGFASRFTFSFSVEFNDNIFFKPVKNSDFVTSFIPGFTLLYAPLGHEIPTFTANIRSPIQIYANNSDRNNFAQNIALDAGYIYNFSPRLIFRLKSDFERVGETRITRLDDLGNAADLVTTGARLSSVWALRHGGAVVDECLAVITYGFAEMAEAFQAANVRLRVLTTFSTVVDEAVAKGRMDERGASLVRDWLADPHGWEPA